MKVRVSILGASAVRDYDDESAVRIFRELSGRLLGLEELAQVENLSKADEAAEGIQEPAKMAPPQSLKAIKGPFT